MVLSIIFSDSGNNLENVMASTLRGVFFDMDGVVIDSKSLWSNILDTVAASFSLDLSLLRKYDGLNLSTKEAMRRVLEDSKEYLWSW